ncbi:MAG: response regulator transcription factor [bacterium]|nr:response regulator transcription factor [bacterium]
MTNVFFQNAAAATEPSKTAILAVDDDDDIHLTLGPYLQQQRYSYSSASNGSELLVKLNDEKPDIILLDIMMPGKDGLRLIQDIRGITKAPIILISGSSSDNTKIAGLEMGADDFMTKPVEPRELTARITAILRRSSSQRVDEPMTLTQAKRINCGSWLLDRQQYQAFNKNGKSAYLTIGEYRLLEALVLSPQCVLSRELLYELTRVNDLNACERSIDAQIARTRKKMNLMTSNRSQIKTIRKVGYMFWGKPLVYAT